MVTDKDGVKRYVPIEIEVHQPPAPVDTTPQKPKRTGGLAIFFRKVSGFSSLSISLKFVLQFYMLAGVRLDDLCEKLNITDVTLIQKIWTVFEHSIRCQTELMRDRHLDQQLMCAVYAICKVITDLYKCGH